MHLSTQVDSIATLVADVEYFIQVCGQILIFNEVPGEHFIHMHGLIFIGLMCLHGIYSSLSDCMAIFHFMGILRGNKLIAEQPTWNYSVPWEPTTEIILLLESLRGNIPFLGSLRGNDSTP
jgi:hypothetical protein